MRWARLLLVVISIPAVGCAVSGDTQSGGGKATAFVEGTTYSVGDVQLAYAFGEDGYFRVEGNDAAHREEDCVPGLGGGLALYGDMPDDVRSLADLAGKELPFEFSGDGDDFNLCFVGTDGLLGVQDGTVRFTSVNGSQVTFSFAGEFVVYDGEGGESEATVSASGSGTAHAATN